MVKVVIGNNLERKTVIVERTSTPREVLEENSIDYAAGVMHLDGVSMQHGDFDKTFDELGIGEKCYLLSVVKASNA